MSQIVTSVDRALLPITLSSVDHWRLPLDQEDYHQFTQLGSINVDCEANATKLVERSQQEAVDTILAGWLEAAAAVLRADARSNRLLKIRAHFFSVSSTKWRV